MLGEYSERHPTHSIHPKMGVKCKALSGHPLVGSSDILDVSSLCNMSVDVLNKWQYHAKLVNIISKTWMFLESWEDWDVPEYFC